MKELKRQKVFVAMSGGVDSSMSAALLKKAGFEAIGVFMKLWPEKYFNKAVQLRVKRIASHLGIPFLVFDFKSEFKRKIVEYFLKEYQRGRTPNPCVKCNKEMKFGLFFKKAMALKADFVATGHYVRKKELQESNRKVYKLLRARDKEKDQSYFLYNLTQKKLKKILFPVGDYKKSKVEKLAEDFKMKKLIRPISQDLCFIKSSQQKFLKKYLKLKPGPIFDSSGKKIGQHQGLPLYTIGQRKEIRIPGLAPYYVAKLDFKKNALFVTNQK
ncbi:tRNA 2-thiouridine(34) synthase MnmA, partial [Patescibacteria group bacterium]